MSSGKRFAFCFSPGRFVLINSHRPSPELREDDVTELIVGNIIKSSTDK